jgi:UDP-N-acetylglucosamine 4,6-dehydratase
MGDGLVGTVDAEAISKLAAGKWTLVGYPTRILVTGGTGTFGHAFVRRVLDDGLFEQVVVYSRDEQKQSVMKSEFDDPRLRFFLGDIRDRDRLVRAFQGVDVVVNAASLKQVDRSGEAIDEFVKTIVNGTLNVVEACHIAGVSKCLGLGTDKEVESTTPYGSCKSVASWILINASAWGPTRCAEVRYGNIVGSRGSVTNVWAEQFEGNGRLRLTDPTMTRFWLCIEDAVDLVLLALDRMRGGEIFIPKNLQHSTIHYLLMQHYPDADYDIVGKRSYEKQHERLVATEEIDRLRAASDVYVLLPHSWNWVPGPYGTDLPPVPVGFEYTSRHGDVVCEFDENGLPLEGDDAHI